MNKKNLLLLALILVFFTSKAQTITGLVFNDANNNGIQESAEVGYPFVTVRAYAPGSITPTASTTTLASPSANLGQYTLTGLTNGVTYRIEFVTPAGYHDAAIGSSTTHSSVQFALAGSSSINYGIRYANECTVNSNPRLVAGQCWNPAAGSPNTHVLKSWNYSDRVAESQLTNFNYATPYAAGDLPFSANTGAPNGVTFNSKNKQIYFSSMAAISSVFPTPSIGYYGLYAADYSGAGNTYLGQKTLVDLATIGISTTPLNQISTFPTNSAGTAGLGQIAVSGDGNYIYGVNMNNNTIFKLNITNVNYASLPVTAPTAADLTSISIPSSIPNAVGGVFRPFALKLKGNVLYIGGINDGSTSANNANVQMVVLAMDLSTNTFTNIFSHNLNSFTAGITQNGYGFAGIFGKVQNYWRDEPSLYADFQPFFHSIEFDDYGAMIIGITNRTVYTATSAFQAGYFVRAARNSSGGYTLENNGTSGSLTSNARGAGSGGAAGDGPGNSDTPNSDGPGGKFFYEVMIHDYHANVFSGGLYVLPGSGELVAGVIDPIAFFEEGARYLRANDGVTLAGKATQSGKGGTLTGTEAVCDANPIEIGNRVWKDVNGNGIQDGDEPGVSGVSVVLCLAGSNTPIATAVTDANGNYIFSTAPGTNTTSKIFNLALTNSTLYDLKVTTLGSNVLLTGYSLTDLTTVLDEVSGVNSGNSLRNSDAFLTAGIPTISILLGGAGENLYTYDFGFYRPPCQVTASVVSGNQSICLGEDPVSFSETTPATGSGTLTYQWQSSTTDCSSGFNDISGALSNVYDPPAISSTTYYRVIITNTDNGNTCTAISNCLTVTVNPLPTADAGSNQNLDCSTTNATIGSSSILGNTYSWSPSLGLNDPSIAQPVASPSSSTNYTVTVTNSFNCTSTDAVVVNVNTAPPTADAGSTQNLDCTTTSATIGTTAIAGNTYSWSPSSGLSATNIAQPTASPTATTVYTVTVTASNGCTATASVTVNVNTTAPTADAGSTQNLDCTTTSATIGTTAIAGNTYSWSPATGLSATNIAQPTASPTTTTTYTVTVTGSNGCTATSTVTVNVNTTAPSVNITGGTIVCNGSTTILTASGANTYVWSNTDMTASTTVGVGTYTVTGTASNGCTSTSSVDVLNQQGSVGNYVWVDLNRDGINNESASAGINGVQVDLYKETAPSSGIYALFATTVTSNDLSSNPGYYNFVICESANYQIHFPTMIGNQQLTIQNATPNTDDNSDANAVSGLSPVFAINVAGSGLSKDNNTLDAGYYAKAQLGNYVWNDIDKDGEQDNNEVGVAGIVVTLYNSSNVMVSTTITDAYGYYKFNPLEPAQYSVGFTLPANYVFTGVNTVGDLIDSDVNPSTGVTGIYTLQSGDSNMSVDAGIHFVAPITATVGNYVWYDTDKDGIQDAGEQGISGVTVTLYNSLNQVVATMITDANGFYLFTDVQPGVYTIGFTLKPGLAFSPNNNTVDNPSNSDANPISGLTSSFTVLAGDNITYVDAGMYNVNIDLPLVGGLGDYVWYDMNQNGIQDGNENGVPGVTVTLYQADGVTVIATTTTNSFGYYIFNALNAGQYVVGFSNLPANYIFTSNAGSDSTTNSDANLVTGKTNIINLGPGQYNMTYDAGIYNSLPGNTNSIGDFVWNDTDKDGIQDAGEQGVAGITVTLYNSSNIVIATTSTNESGYYLFPDLPNGIYYVGFSNLPIGYVFSPTGNGTSSTDTDPNPATGLTNSVTLNGNTHITDLDAGINLGNTKLGLGTLGDLVWYDLDGDGLQDPNELGVPGVTVTLYESDGTTVLNTTTTNALGYYIFTGLEGGNYVVGFSNLPSGFVISPKDADSQGLNGESNSDVNTLTQKTDIIVLGNGEDKMSVDMGIVPPAGTASLGNYVWFDLNNDGLQTPGEPGVQGVSVTLYDVSNNPIATTTTNQEGEYYFVGLVPGTYSVGFSNLPQGYILATYNVDNTGINGTQNSDADPVSGRTVSVTLASGENNPNLDAGIISTIVASVGDYVWFDEDRDGIQDPTETGIGGILVTLYDNTNTPVASTITDPNGGYIFTNVAPGTYTIGFSNIPVGMEFTQQVGGPADNDNSNVNPLTGITASFTVVAGTHNPTIDAGLTTPALCGLGNYVWFDLDKDGLQDANEAGVAGVLVRLYAADLATILATTTTDGAGQYSFTSLPAGTYAVGFFNIPNGYNRTQVVGAINDATNSDMNADGKTNAVTLIAGEFNPNLDAGIYFGFPLPAHELVATLAMIKEVNVCEVNWFTRDEQSTSHFEIQRSINGVDFELVGNLSASGSTTGLKNYSYNDDIEVVSQQDVIYYRIKLIDVDGKQSFSNVISVKPIDIQAQEVSIYPIPFRNDLMINYPSLENSDVVIELTDLSGRVIKQKNAGLDKGLNTIVLSDLNSLSSGQYIIRLKNTSTGEVHIRKLLK